MVVNEDERSYRLVLFTCYYEHPVLFVSVCARWLSRTFPFGSSLVVLLLLNMIVSSSDERVYHNVG